MNGEAFRGSFNDVRHITISLLRQTPDSPDLCPVPVSEIQEHAELESDDGTDIRISKPEFLRTAQIGQVRFWIWKYIDPRRCDGYLLVALYPSGQTVLTDEDTFGLTPEQFIVATHFQLGDS